MRSALLILLLSAITVGAQVGSNPSASQDVVFVCPMDRDIRSSTPGNCPRCGMKLAAGIPEPVEFHMDLEVMPKPLRPGETARLRFDVRDPWKNNSVSKFNLVHEKPFHAFVVSQDLEFFLHNHPVWETGAFTTNVTLPSAGMYRVLADFYPEAASPQLIAKTVFVAGDAPVKSTRPLQRDYSKKTGANLTVQLSITPAEPVAGGNTQMRFHLDPAEGIERYLGTWGHMLAVSDDLIDMVHTHPLLNEGGPEIQFDVTFGRPRTYRTWVQFQRNGVVNTVHFDVAVGPAPHQ